MSTYGVPDILESIEVTKISKMIFLTMRNSGLVREADRFKCVWSVPQQMHMGTEVPERREQSHLFWQGGSLRKALPRGA